MFILRSNMHEEHPFSHRSGRKLYCILYCSGPILKINNCNIVHILYNILYNILRIYLFYSAFYSAFFSALRAFSTVSIVHL
ncbi:MAG: hypothetical protein RIR48_445 [Bacteroidota bacterium]